MHSIRTLFVVAVILCFVPGGGAQTLPAPPQTLVDSSYPLSTGSTISVAAGGDLQAALNLAQPGDTILLPAGATFSGSFTLSAKSGTGWIIVRTSAPDSSLPPEGTRISPAYAAVMPKIVAPGTMPAVQTAPGAHHYRFVGIEFTVAPDPNFPNYGIVWFGDGSSAQSSTSQLPYALVLDRVYVHGLPTAGVRRGVALNSGSAAIVDSYISEIHEVGADTQAVAGWNGPGPFKIANSYLEAAGENIMFGGADPAIQNLVPSDIEIRGNHVSKPIAWIGSTWTVKNLFELKNARRVLVDGNVFEYNWVAAQNGFSILFTVRNQGGTAPWSTVEDVTFTHNIVRHVASGVNILGTDNIYPSQQTKRILLKDNLFDDVNGAAWGGGSGRLFQVLNGTADVTIDHNTAFQSGDIVVADGAANSGFVFTSNLAPNNVYGVGGSGTFGNPILTLSTFFPSAIFRRNAIVGGASSSYPTDNFFPATLANVGFTDLAGGNYKLAVSSAYKNAGTDGKDVGADFDALNAATANAVNGAGSAVLSPPTVLTATATSGTQVSVSWLPSAGATSFEIARSSAGGVFGIIGTSATNSFTDNTVVANTAYLYEVRAVDGSGNRSPYSNLDLAITVIFTDDPLVSQSTSIKAVHVTQLRVAVNAARVLAGLTPMVFTDPVLSAGMFVKAVHVSEMRSGLDAARSQLGLVALSYTDPTLTGMATTVKAAHLQELRGGVK